MPHTSFSIDTLLEQVSARSASDLHLTAYTPPVIRVRGELERLSEFESLTPEHTRELLYRMLSTERQKQLEIKRQLDFSYAVPGLARFRVNVYFQRESLGAAFRLIPDGIKSAEELGLPAVLIELATRPRGLVLVTGPTGSGKSTTLATMLDLETIATALTAAETGHLVLATLHTQSAPGTIDRIIDVFPAEQQGQIRTQLAASLEGVVTQTLLPTLDGHSRVPALEVLLPDDAVRNLIRQAKVEQIYSVMQTSTSRGMQTMEQSLADLTIRRVIAEKVALAASSRPDEFKSALERSGFESGSDDHLPPALRGLQVAGAQR